MVNVKQMAQQFQNKIGSQKADVLKTLYTEKIRPAYVRRYGSGSMPTELFVDEGDPGIDGAGSPGLVLVSGGVANHIDPAIRIFAVAHESGHCVAFREFQRVGVTAYQPINDDAKRHEHIADLIAIKVLKDNRSDLASVVVAKLNLIAQALGNGDQMHPTGQERAALIRRFIQGQSFGSLIAALANRQI